MSNAVASTPSQRPADLAAHDGRQRAAGDDGAAHVGAAAPVDQQHVWAELLVEVVVALGRAAAIPRSARRGCSRGRSRGRAAGRPCGRPSGTRGSPPSPSARVSSASRHCCARSGQAGSPSSSTIELRSSSAATSAFHIIHAVVVNHSRRPPGLRSQPSPRFLTCSSEDAAVPVHDRLRQPGRARREEHVERMVERHRLELERPGSAQQTLPAVRVIAVRHLDHVLQRRQPRGDRGDLRPAVDARLAGSCSR